MKKLSSYCYVLAVAILACSTPVRSQTTASKPKLSLPASQVAWELVAQRESEKIPNNTAWLSFAAVADMAKAHPEWTRDQLLDSARHYVESARVADTLPAFASDVLSTLPFHGDLVMKWGLEYSKYIELNRNLVPDATGLQIPGFGTIRPDMWSNFYALGIADNKRLGPVYDYLSHEYFRTTLTGSSDEILQPFPDLQNNILIKEILDTVESQGVKQSLYQDQTDRLLRKHNELMRDLTSKLQSRELSGVAVTGARSIIVDAGKEIRTQASEYQAEIYAVSSLGQLFNDPKTKAAARDFGVVAGAAVKAWESVALYDAAAIGAGAATAGVVGAGVAIVSLFLQSNSDDGMAAAMKQLSAQITGLYNEMGRQFDIINQRLDSVYWFSNQTYLTTLRTERNLQEARNDISAAEEGIFSIEEGAWKARDAIIQANQRLALAPCYEYKNSSLAIPSNDVVRCTSQLLGVVAEGTSQDDLSDLGLPSLRQSFHDHSLSDVVGNALRYAQANGVIYKRAPPARLVRPAVWEAGVDSFLQFVNANPGPYVNAISNWQDQALRLRAPGVALSDVLVHLAGDAGADRATFFNFLASKYHLASDDLVKEVRLEEDRFFDDAIEASSNLPAPPPSVDHNSCNQTATLWGEGGDRKERILPAGFSPLYIGPDLFDKLPLFRNRGGLRLDGTYLMGPTYLCVDRITNNSMNYFSGNSDDVYDVSIWADNKLVANIKLALGSVHYVGADGKGYGESAETATMWARVWRPAFLQQIDATVIAKMHAAILEKMRGDPDWKAANLINLQKSLRAGDPLRTLVQQAEITKELLTVFVELSMPETAAQDVVRGFLQGSLDVQLVDGVFFSSMLGCATLYCTGGAGVSSPLYKSALAGWPEELVSERWQKFSTTGLPLILDGSQRDQIQTSLTATLASLDGFCMQQSLLRSTRSSSKLAACSQLH